MSRNKIDISYNAVVLDPLVLYKSSIIILDRYGMIDWRDGCSCVVFGLSREHRAAFLRGVLFKKQIHSKLDRIFLAEWFFPVQVRFFFTTAFLYLCSVSDIDHALSFYCTCRYFDDSTHRQSVSPLLSVPDCFGEPFDTPKGGLSPSRLVLSLLSFVCSCLYMFPTIWLHFTPSLIKLIGTALKDSLCRISTRPNYHNYRVRGRLVLPALCPRS